MPRPARLLAAPIPAVGRARLTAGSLASLVAADVVRRAAAEDGPEPSVGVYVEVGSLLAQHAVERLLVREGHDRASLGPVAFAERVAQLASETHDDVDDLAALLDLRLAWPASSVDPAAVEMTARTAFVRLYDEGLLEEFERVAPVCARCSTVVTLPDLEVASHDAELVTVRMPTDRGGPLEVALFSLELLPGVVAIGVPPGHELDGAKATVPVTGAVVPVLADPTIAAPSVLVPAHDPVAWGLARIRGMFPEPVLDAAGVVRAAGPLQGLGRFAARAAARDRLAATASIVRVEPAEEPAPRCRECGTAVVFVLGRHWVLSARALGRAAADVVREGEVAFTPATARDDFLGMAGEMGEWIVSSDIWGGSTVPAAVCDDCGSVAVEVRPSTTCRRCFGSLRPDARSLDGRFVSACWLLAAAGWPAHEDGPFDTADATAVIAPPGGMRTWVVPAAALGLRLAGRVPFAKVAIHDLPGGAAGPVPPLETGDRRAARLWLAGGADDLEHAAQLLAGLAKPLPGQPGSAQASPEEVASAMASAASDLHVAQAAVALRSVLAGGVPSSAAARLRRVAALITGG